MSALPRTNGKVACEWIEHARAYYSVATGTQGIGGNKVAVRSLVSAAEMALKAVYISHETYFPRTHSTGELIEGCPDRSVHQLLASYSDEFVEDFSTNYLAPYIREEPVSDRELEACRAFTETIISWATTAVTD